MVKMLALDTETTGLDLRHGSLPYFVTTCDQDGVHVDWEWEVDPLTRRVHSPGEDYVLEGDILGIREIIGSADVLILHNSKFDYTALKALDPRTVGLWDWGKVKDTLAAAHLLDSNFKHDLTSAVSYHVSEDIVREEDQLEEATQQARRLARSKLKDWRIAKAGEEDMPSVKGGGTGGRKAVEKGKTWKADMWLPRAICLWAQKQLETYVPEPRKPRARKDPPPPWWWEYADPDHPWLTVLAKYADYDSSSALLLWEKMWEKIQKRKLEKNFLFFNQKPRLAVTLEENGVTLSGERLKELEEKFAKGSEDAAQRCVDIAAVYKYELKLPKTGNNRSLVDFCYGEGSFQTGSKEDRAAKRETEQQLQEQMGSLLPKKKKNLNLPVVARTDTGMPSLSKYSLDQYMVSLKKGTIQYTFVSSLVEKRARDTGLQFLANYKRFWHPFTKGGGDGKGHVLLTPETCPCKGESSTCPVCEWGLGVCANCGRAERELRQLCDKVRWYILHPSLNPFGTDTLRWSSTNPNEQNISKREGFNLRYVFGPGPGRIWASMDAQNIELRIPTFEAGEQDLIDVFLKPKEPPYFGSYHLVIFDLLHPELFRQHGKECKNLFESTWYQWVKNGNFAVIYGAQRDTADKTYHVDGAFDKIRKRFPKIAALSDRQIKFAQATRYVQTIPSKRIDPVKGYPLKCSFTEFGRVVPTVPLNYHVSGTAMQWTTEAMVVCQDRLDEWKRRTNFSGFMTLQVHDEMVFDFPVEGDVLADAKFEKENGRLPLIRSSNLWRLRELQKLMESCGESIGVPTPVGVEIHTNNWAEGISI